MKIRSAVTRVPAAQPAAALAHFEHRLTVETDCWDVHDSMQRTDPGFVLLDVRSPDLFEAGHVPGATSLPHPEIRPKRMAAFPDDTLFVVYCAGPHCNGAGKAAIKLAKMGRPVKEMIGGVEGWKDEGFSLETGLSESSLCGAGAPEMDASR